MKLDIIICGVGGQGVISVASIIAKGAIKAGFQTRQSEVHGMAQRGGSVLAHLRIADETIESDLIPRQSADLILSTEPIESLRYLEYLKQSGTLITSVPHSAHLAHLIIYFPHVKLKALLLVGFTHT